MSDFSPDGDMGDDWEEDYPEIQEVSRENLTNFIAEFIATASDAETTYRKNFCQMSVSRAYRDFGYEGMCEMLIAIDDRANWVSDILIEASDIDNHLFNKYGTFSSDVMRKARKTEAMFEMNQKIWNLRKKYSKKIADEIFKMESDEDNTQN